MSAGRPRRWWTASCRPSPPPTRSGAPSARESCSRWGGAGRSSCSRRSDYRPLPAESLPDLVSLRGFNTPAEYLAAVAEDGQAGRAALEFVGRPRMLAGCAGLEVPIGSLASVLSHAPAPLELCRGEQVAPSFLVSLGGRDFVRDTRIPVGPGERVIVLDASAGG